MQFFRPRAKKHNYHREFGDPGPKTIFSSSVWVPGAKTTCSQKALGSRKNNYQRRFWAQVAAVAWCGFVPLLPTIQPTIESNFSTCRGLQTCWTLLIYKPLKIMKLVTLLSSILTKIKNWCSKKNYGMVSGLGPHATQLWQLARAPSSTWKRSRAKSYKIFFGKTAWTR